LDAKAKGKGLNGLKEAYAANIMYLVSNELNLRIKIERIAKLSGPPPPLAIKKSHKRLQNVFKEWYR
jgi:hypothetical protein